MPRVILALCLAAFVGCVSDGDQHVDASEGAAGSAAVDVGVKSSALTLHSSYASINSDGGGAIWRSLTGMDIARCYVMSQSFTGPNTWACTFHGGSGIGVVTATCTRGTTTWRTTNCSSSGCVLQKCVSGSCTNKGTALYTSDPDTLFSASPLDGYTTVTCKGNGHPTLRRYTP
jgi:hypothetical protein